MGLEEYVLTDVALGIRFDSRVILLDDLAALVTLSRDLLNALEAEVAVVTGQEIEFLPEVTVSKGSIKLDLKLKCSSWNLDLRLRVHEVILATVLYAMPVGAGEAPRLAEHQPSDQCVEMVGTALQNASQSWAYFGKGFESEIEVACGTAKAKYRIHNPPRGR